MKNVMKDILKRLKSPVVLFCVATIVYKLVKEFILYDDYIKMVDVVAYVVLGYGVFNNPLNKKGF